MFGHLEILVDLYTDFAIDTVGVHALQLIDSLSFTLNRLLPVRMRSHDGDRCLLVMRTGIGLRHPELICSASLSMEPVRSDD